MTKTNRGKVRSPHTLGQVIGERRGGRSMQINVDRQLVALFRVHWPELSNGRPIVATTHLFDAVGLTGLEEIWRRFVDWRTTVRDRLPEEEQVFSTTIDSETVWVIEDEAGVFTLMYPEDY